MDYTHMRVATKYPHSAVEFFDRQGMQMEIIKLNGSIELAPIVGLSELIVDIVETGTTIRENHLKESPRFMKVRRVSLPIRSVSNFSTNASRNSLKI